MLIFYKNRGVRPFLGWDRIGRDADSCLGGCRQLLVFEGNRCGRDAGVVANHKVTKPMALFSQYDSINLLTAFFN